MHQAFSLLVVLIACASIVVGNGTQIIDWHALNDAEPNQDDSHIQFVLYTRKLKEGTTDMSHLRKKLHTFVLIHGFNDNLKESIMLPLLTKNYLNRERCNVVVVDWAEFAKGPWFINAAKNTLLVGKDLAAWLDTSGLDMRRVTLVGFSMGAHVAGDAGHFAQKRVSRIVALDPAHFLFQNSPPEFRLDSTDAEIVEVVHTSGGYVGEKEALGTRDFFPNGGTYPQPGCSPDPTGTCSHRRAYYYYSEAIVRPDDNFKGRRCNSYDHFVKHKCLEKGIPTILHLVNTNVDKKLTGNFYFMTNSKEPYIRRNGSHNGTSTTERQPLTTDKQRAMSTTDSRRTSFKEHSTTDKHRLEKEKLADTTESRQSTAKSHLTTEKHGQKDRQLDNKENHQTTEKHRPGKDHGQLTSTDRRSVDKEHLTTDKYRPGIDRQHLTSTDLRSTKEHWTTHKYRTTKEKQLDFDDNRRPTAREHLTTDKYRPGKDRHHLTTTDRRSNVEEHSTTDKYRPPKGNKGNRQSAEEEMTTLKKRSTWSREPPTSSERLMTDRHRYFLTDDKPRSKYESTTSKRHWTTSAKRSAITNERNLARIGRLLQPKVDLSLADGYL